MKLIFVSTIVCLILIAEKSYGQLRTCPQVGDCPDHATCPAAGQACQCDSGYHLNATNDGCVQDIAPGATCTTKDSDVECVNNATCTNTAAEGQAEALQCTCNSGFHIMSGACVADLAPGATCTTKDSENECVDNAMCTDTAEAGQPEALQCSCNSGFHDMSGACVADIELGATCTTKDSDVECVDNAVCMNMAAEGEAESLQCTCKAGFHNMSNACVADLAPGATCTTKDSENECVDNATCTNTAAEGQAEALQCTCNSGFHDMPGACAADLAPGATCTTKDIEECVDNAKCANTAAEGEAETLKCTCNPEFHNMSGACVADTCTDTVDKCKAAGVADCTQKKAFIECLLKGVCDPDDAGELDVFAQALQDLRPIPADCAVTDTSTCALKVSSCLLSFLKANTTCTSITALETCLGDAKAGCTTEEDLEVYALANAYMSDLKENASCECLKEINDCTAASEAILKDEAADQTAKCNAVKDLFTCAMTDKCNTSKAIDHSAVSSTWSLAMAYANDTGCKDSITEEDATSCELQLTRCALIYGEDQESANGSKSEECRAAETFGSCLADKTGLCTEDDADKKKLFTDQYELVSGTCVCENFINMCSDEAGVVPSDPAVACPKLQAFSVCILGATCDMTQPQNALLDAYDWYTGKKAEHNCSIADDNTCATDVAVCADKLSSTSHEGLSSSDMCREEQDTLMCVLASNCSSSAEEDAKLLNTSMNGSLFRLASLSCEELTCDSSFSDVTDCKDAYQDDFTAAGSDDTKKCNAQKAYSGCLKEAKCNVYLEDLVTAELDGLNKELVPGCDLSNGGVPSAHISLLPVLVSLLVGCLVLRL